MIKNTTFVFLIKYPLHSYNIFVIINLIRYGSDTYMMKIKLTKKLPGEGYYKSFNLKALYNFSYQNTNKIITKL